MTEPGSMTRRGFLAAAASVVVMPRLQKRPIVGSGEHTYEVFHDWLPEPSFLKWGDTHGLAVDSQGRIYVAHTVHPSSVTPNAVVVFDPQGKRISTWGADFKGGAHGLDLRKEGSDEFLYHCDIRRRLVVKTTLDGEVVWSRGYPKESGKYASEEAFCPTNVAFAPNGDLFVGDGYGSSYIHRYTQDGEYRGVVVEPGSEAGKVRQPHGLWIDHRGHAPELVVADRGNRRLQRFTLDGKHLGFVTEGMRMPCHVHYKRDLALVPDLESVVTILDRDNKVVASLGDGHPSNLRDAPRSEFIPGKFIHPHAAVWINDRDILVAEWVPIGRLTLLRKVS
jgi:hypothetical protein